MNRTVLNPGYHITVLSYRLPEKAMKHSHVFALPRVAPISVCGGWGKMEASKISRATIYVTYGIYIARLRKLSLSPLASLAVVP